MQSGSVAKRYSRALIELSGELGKVDVVLQELEAFERLLHESLSLNQVLISPSFTASVREQVLREILGKVAYLDLTSRFLLFLTRKRRMNIFPDIVREFRNYYDNLHRLVRVSIVTAKPLAAEIEREIVARIEAHSNRKVVLTKRVDPSMIGGIVTHLGGLLIDGSIRTQLALMRTSLLQEHIGT